MCITTPWIFLGFEYGEMNILVAIYRNNSNISLGGKKDLFPPPSKFLPEVFTTQDRLIREKHTRLFNMSFMWHRRLHKEVRPEEVEKPECFLREAWWREGELWENVVRKERVGEAARPTHSDSSGYPSVFPGKAVLSEGGTPHMGILWPASGEGEKVPPALCHFLNLSAWSIQYAKVSYVGVWGSEPHYHHLLIIKDGPGTEISAFYASSNWMLQQQASHVIFTWLALTSFRSQTAGPPRCLPLSLSLS